MVFEISIGFNARSPGNPFNPYITGRLEDVETCTRNLMKCLCGRQLGISGRASEMDYPICIGENIVDTGSIAEV